MPPQDSSSTRTKNLTRFFAVLAVFFIYAYLFNGLADLPIFQSPQNPPLAQILKSTNLAPNAGFESDPCAVNGGWLVAYSSLATCGVTPFLWSTTQAHSGTRSVEITNPTLPIGAAYVRWLSNSSLVSAQAGKTYQGSMWVKTQNAQGSIAVVGNFWNGSTHLQTFSVSPVLGVTQDWMLVTVSGTAPAGTTNMRVELRRMGTGGQTLSGTVWVDDVSIQEVTTNTPTQNPTLPPPPQSSGLLPSPWVSQDIGLVALAGSATYISDIFTINGDGSNIFGTSDSFHFVHRQLTGDGEIKARVVSVEDTSPYARAGVMMRETLSENSRHALMVVKPNALLEFLRRVSVGGSTIYALGNTAPAPHWVRLVRSGSIITAYASSDGVSWTMVGSDTFISLSPTIYIGLAVGGLNTLNINTSVFDNVVVTQTTQPNPTLPLPPPPPPPPPPSPSSQPSLGTHPNLLLNQAEIQELRAALGNPTGCTAISGLQYLKDAWNRVCAAAPSGTSPSHNYSNTLYGQDWHVRYVAELTDGYRLVHAAMAYAITGNSTYADAVRAIIFAWVNGTNTNPNSLAGSADHGIADWGFNGFALAYDLTYNSGVYSGTDRTSIESWFANFVAPISGAKPHYWYPKGFSADYYYDGYYNHYGYINEFQTNNILYAMVGALLGDQTRYRWATLDQFPYSDFRSPYGRTPDYFATYPGRNPRSLHEFIRGAIYNQGEATMSLQRTDSYYPDPCNTSGSCSGTNQTMTNHALGPVPSGSTYDYHARGPYPRNCPDVSGSDPKKCSTATGPSTGAGQGYQLLQVEAFAIHAALAWHQGDDLAHQTLGGHTIKNASNFVRPIAAHVNVPRANRVYSPLYNLIYSLYRDPADLAFLQKTGDCADCGASGRGGMLYWLGYSWPLIGYADRSNAPGNNAVSPTPTPTPLSTKFSINDRIVTNSSSINVRSVAGGTIVGIQGQNIQGTVVGGPTQAVVSGVAYWFWNINFDSGADGWVGENLIDKVQASTGQKNIFTRRYIYTSVNLDGSSVEIDRLIRIMERGKNAGYNGIVLNDLRSSCSWIANPSATCATNIARIKAAATSWGMAVVPVYFTGTEQTSEDASLAEAWPMRDTPFRVNTQSAALESDLGAGLLNGSMESWGGSPIKPVSWNVVGPGTQDTVERFAGAGSIRFTNPTGTARIGQRVAVKRWRTYELSMMLKTSNYCSGCARFYVEGWNGPGHRVLMNQRDAISVNGTQGWTRHKVIFTSLDTPDIDIYLVADATSAGSLWVDDVKLTEVGLTSDTIQRVTTPVVVTSENGLTTYTKGVDYTVGTQTLSIPAGSKITNGQLLKVDWWKRANAKWTYDALASWCQQRTIDLARAHLNRIMNRYGSGGGFMINWDEMYAFNWDPDCGDMSSLIPGRAGEYLANKVMRISEQLVHEIDPARELYVWNDMFDPYHNARENDYTGTHQMFLVNGSLKSSVPAWSGVSQNTIIMNWIPPILYGGIDFRPSLKFWAGTDPLYPKVSHRQIVAGYYDTINNVSQWMTLLDQQEAEGLSGIVGFLYTTWDNGSDGYYGKYDDLEAAANIIKAAGRWGTGPVPSITPTPTPTPIPTPTEPLVLVSGPTSSQITETTADITWTLNHTANGRTNYGLTSAYGSSLIETSDNLYATHVMTLRNLTPATTYHYKIISTDSRGSTVSSGDLTFTTLGGTPTPILTDTAAPMFSSMAANTVTTNSTTISWNTDEPATSRVEYGISTTYGSQTSFDSTLVTSHSALLGGLSPNTTYHYRVIAQDASGNIATSLNRTFQTKSLPDTQGPGAVSNLSLSNTTQVSTRLMWAAPQDYPIGQVSAYDIRYSTSPITQSNFAGATEVSGEPTPSMPGTQETYALAGLQHSTSYYVAIRSQDSLGNSSLISNVITFTTQSPTPTPVAFDFALSHGGSRTVTQGNKVVNTITATLLSGSTQQVIFSVSGLPSGATASFGQVSCNPNCQSTLTIDTQSSTPLGQVTIVVSATAASVTRTASFTLTVEAAPSVLPPTPQASFNFFLAHSGDVSTIKGDRVINTITATLLEGATQQVSFSAAGLPNNTSASFGQTSCNPNCQITLTIQTQSSASEGSFPITVTAGGGDTTKTVSFMLMIKALPQITQAGGGGVAPGSGGGGGGMIFDNTPPSRPSHLQVFGGSDQIILLWQNPSDADFVRTIIVRKEGSAPTAVADGIIVYEGTAKEYTDTKVQKGKTYYYTLYSFDQRINYSQPSTASSYLGKHTEQEIVMARNATTVSSGLRISSQIKGIIITKYLQIGSKHQEVALLQKHLQDLGLFPKTQAPTGFFGPMTGRALKSYQTSKGIEPTGGTGPKTRRALKGNEQTQIVPSQTAMPIQKWLVFGSRGEDVRTLQTILKRKGYFPKDGTISGNFDSTTRASLGRFQCVILQVCSGSPGTTGYGATGPRTRKALSQLP